MFSRRITGCSAFGFGGTNGHVCLEDAPPPPPVGGSEQEWHLFTVSARTAGSLKAYAAKLSTFLDKDGGDTPRLADLCYTSTLRTQYPFRLALSVNSLHSLKEQLRVATVSGGSTKADNGDRKVAFEFPDSGTEYSGMGQELYATQPVFKAKLDECDQLLGRQLGKPLKDVLFQPGGMANSAHAQPALFAYQYALAQLWLSWGVSPSVVAGHGVGEFVAGVIAGIFSLADGLKMVMMRAQLLGTDPTWAMGGQMFGMVANMVTYTAPTIPFVSGKTGQVGDAAVSTGDYWVYQPLYKLDVPTVVAAAKALGVDVFAQVGPGAAHAATGKQARDAEGGKQALDAEGASWIASMDQSMPEPTMLP
jgi:acyl transferase domain-containing protein